MFSIFDKSTYQLEQVYHEEQTETHAGRHVAAMVDVWNAQQPDDAGTFDPLGICGYWIRLAWSFPVPAHEAKGRTSAADLIEHAEYVYDVYPMIWRETKIGSIKTLAGVVLEANMKLARKLAELATLAKIGAELAGTFDAATPDPAGEGGNGEQ